MKAFAELQVGDHTRRLVRDGNLLRLEGGGPSPRDFGDSQLVSTERSFIDDAAGLDAAGLDPRLDPERGGCAVAAPRPIASSARWNVLVRVALLVTLLGLRLTRSRDESAPSSSSPR